MKSFIFGGDTGKSYEDLQRIRAQQAQFNRGVTQRANSFGSGLHVLGAAFASRIAKGKGDKIEAAGRADFDGNFDAIMSDPNASSQQIAEAAGNGFASKGQSGALQQLLAERAAQSAFDREVQMKGIDHGYDVDKIGAEYGHKGALQDDSQAFKAGESALGHDRDLTKMGVKFGYDGKLQDDQQSFTAGENALGRAHSTNERVAGQDFTAGENALGRTFKTTERMAGQDFTAMQTLLGQRFTSGENSKDRSHRTDERVGAQRFTAGENALGRKHSTNERIGSQSFKAGENTLDRAQSANQFDRSFQLDQQKAVDAAYRTNDTKNYQAYVTDAVGRGEEPMSMLDYQTAQKRAGASSVNVNSGGNFKVPAGYMADPENGGRVVPIPGSPAAREADAGRVAVEASIATMDDSMSVIDAAMSHPGFDANFGMSSLLKNMPGGDAAGAATFLDQIDGKAFLQAFESLKGGGQITEIEGRKATQAIARLGRAQSPEDARVALSDLRGVMAKARGRADQQLLGFTGGKADAQDDLSGMSDAELLKALGG